MTPNKPEAQDKNHNLHMWYVDRIRNAPKEQRDRIRKEFTNKYWPFVI